MTEGRWREGLERKGGRVEEKKGGGGIAYFDQGIPSIARGPLPELIYLVRHHGKLGISEYQTLSNSILSVM